MTTILPQKNKKEIKKKYLFGFLSKTLNILSVALIIWLVFEVTVYYIAGFENKSALEEKDTKEFAERNNLIYEYREVLSDSKKLVKLFENEKETKTDFLNYLFSLIPDGISLNKFSINEIEEEIFVEISGVAVSRDSLSQFNENLKNQDQISEVILPSSFFTKTFDIDFSLSFKYEYEKK